MTDVNEALAALQNLKGGDLLRIPVPALNVPRFKPGAVTTGKVTKALLYGDTHFPYQDDSALAIVAAIAQDLQPDVLVHMGDLVDSSHLSLKFKPDPHRTVSLQDEIDMARKHLAQMRMLLPKAKIVVLEGNHEERLTRVLWNLEGPAKALSLLTGVKHALTWPVLLGTEQLGIEFVPYAEQSKHLFLPKFIVKHGSVVRQLSSYTARAEWAKYGRSGASGHTHRLGMFWHRDHNGNHVWLETGTTMRLDPDYTTDPDWQQGCVVVTFDPKTGAPGVEPVYIANGIGMWRGKLYAAK